jgi:hypothetical protein
MAVKSLRTISQKFSPYIIETDIFKEINRLEYILGKIINLNFQNFTNCGVGGRWAAGGNKQR